MIKGEINKLEDNIKKKFKLIFNKEFKNFDLKVDLIDLVPNTNMNSIILDVLMKNDYCGTVLEFNIIFSFVSDNLIKFDIILIYLNINLFSSLIVRKLEIINNDFLKCNIIDYSLISSIEDYNMKLNNRKIN
mgnify:CR=1 FL=1|jgi:hypothetical protein